ncbi:MAG: PEP/pyruvate-binding domain-containing protein, partial [Phycisphaerales bacterium JB038]
FKNSSFPPELSKGLAAALDDFEDRPIIVRSSSLLEDQVGAAFSGKYKSLYLANQGTKKERLDALQDAIAEVYASVFGPDPIEYRAERGLLDFREEMGILIQEVVGQRVGKYFFPSFAGVAFSNNEFRWSTRIRRDDGLVRMVPGLGTRAVDRLSDDYPVLVSPGQPGLRVNISLDEVLRYSPHWIDVINLETNEFETVEVRQLLREVGDDYPAAGQIVSIVERDRVRTPRGLEPDWEKQEFVVTFEGLFSNTPFIEKMGAVLRTLRDKLQMPVDVEFASDGEHIYLVQCRSQSHSMRERPATIPPEIPREQLLFSASRYISNGRVPDITHIVYVDPDRYADIDNLEDLRAVGRIVGQLNSILPRRQFILMGPGRWGSRGDVKLGVDATYSDINNTAVLIEIARQKGNYVPELSFGTHFFQDLVEAEIRYLPLYPDSRDNAFNEHFFLKSNNILSELIPGAKHLEHVVRVIDVPAEAKGKVLRVLMNAEIERAVGMLSTPVGEEETSEGGQTRPELKSENHWRWRLRMAEQLAASLDGAKYGVKGAYLFGSTKNANAGPASDINLILHLTGENHIRPQLSHWLEGWSQALAEMNYLRTGHKSDGLLDVHYVTDRDIARQTSFAAKIGAVTDAARALRLQSAAP